MTIFQKRRKTFSHKFTTPEPYAAKNNNKEERPPPSNTNPFGIPSPAAFQPILLYLLMDPEERRGGATLRRRGEVVAVDSGGCDRNMCCILCENRRRMLIKTSQFREITCVKDIVRDSVAQWLASLLAN